MLKKRGKTELFEGVEKPESERNVVVLLHCL